MIAWNEHWNLMSVRYRVWWVKILILDAVGYQHLIINFFEMDKAFPSASFILQNWTNFYDSFMQIMTCILFCWQGKIYIIKSLEKRTPRDGFPWLFTTNLFLCLLLFSFCCRKMCFVRIVNANTLHKKAFIKFHYDSRPSLSHLHTPTTVCISTLHAGIQ